VSGTGSSAIVDNGALFFGNAVAAGQTVTFSGNNYGQLELADAQDFAGTVAGFAGTAAGYGTSDSIVLGDINFSSAQFNLAYAPNTGGTGGVLTVTDGTNTANIKFSGSYVQSNFVAQS
jgi:hypothetical protein